MTRSSLHYLKHKRAQKRRAEMSTSLLREGEKNIAAKQDIVETDQMEPVGVALSQLIESNPSGASASSPTLPTVETEEKSMCKVAGRDTRRDQYCHLCASAVETDATVISHVFWFREVKCHNIK